jgi:hypothetical protein
MKVRADVAELLRAGHSNRAIARQLHTDAKDVAEARKVLGLPKAKPGKKPTGTAEDLFWRRAKLTDDGHMEWTGFRINGTPALRHGGKNITAYRIAFKIRHRREPVGNVTGVCGIDGCVHPDCMADRPMRQASRPGVHRPGSRPRYASLKDAFEAKTERDADDHVRWRGYVDTTSNTPMIFHGRQRTPAPKAAFILHHGRDPVGKPLPTCGVKGCIAGGHLADRPMRESNERADKAFEAIFGQSA